MKELNRTKVGDFSINNSITIEELENGKSNNFITVEDYFKNYKNIKLNEKKLKLFLNGVQLTWNLEDGIYRIYCDNEFIGIGTIKNNLLKRDIIL